MRELFTDDIKRIGLEILRYLKDICDKNGITYYLTCGTLLGAIRHKGFIPWDDDIDVCMKRDDYEKLVKIMEENPCKRYKLLSIETNSKYSLPLAKLIDSNTLVHQLRQNEVMPIGIWVDIFILDEVPEDYNERIKFYNKLDFLQKCWEYIQYKKDYPQNSLKCQIKKLIHNVALKIFKARYFAVMLNNYAQKYRYSNSSLFGDAEYSPDRLANTFKKKYWEKSILWEFEGELFNIPVGYHEYLTDGYGNYMELPPIEERISNHSIKAYYID